MRARLHARDGRLGFYPRRHARAVRCGGRPASCCRRRDAWIARREARAGATTLTGCAAIEIAENVAGDRARRVISSCTSGADPALRQLAEPGADRPVRAARRSRGVERSPASRRDRRVQVGDAATAASAACCGATSARSFRAIAFCSSRWSRHVVALVPPGPVVDLYAGVGLFGLSLAAAGAERVTLVEGDPRQRRRPARPTPSRSRDARARRARAASRRSCARLAPADRPPTFIVDPPRTGHVEGGARRRRRACARRGSSTCRATSPRWRATRARCSTPATSSDGLTGFDLFPEHRARRDRGGLRVEAERDAGRQRLGVEPASRLQRRT